MTIKQRIQSPTPPVFKKIRKAGLLLTAAGTTLLAAPVVLPAFMLQVAGYMMVAGTVAAAVSQVTTGEDAVQSASGE